MQNEESEGRLSYSIHTFVFVHTDSKKLDGVLQTFFFLDIHNMSLLQFV